MNDPQREGQLVPIVLFPRFTSLLGATTFYGFAYDVRAYSAVRVTMWRGPLVGDPSATFKFYFEESTDRVNWVACNGTASGEDPGENAESQGSFAVTHRWFRSLVTMQGLSPPPGVTCWAQGFLFQRLT